MVPQEGVEAVIPVTAETDPAEAAEEEETTTAAEKALQAQEGQEEAEADLVVQVTVEPEAVEGMVLRVEAEGEVEEQEQEEVPIVQVMAEVVPEAAEAEVHTEQQTFQTSFLARPAGQEEEQVTARTQQEPEEAEVVLSISQQTP
jgi:hypothetical protein